MKGKQWSKLLSKDSLSDEEWENARISSSCWCSCPIGVFVLGDRAVEDPKELSVLQINEKNRKVKEGIPTYEYLGLGQGFFSAIRHHDLTEARKIWNKIHGDKKWKK